MVFIEEIEDRPWEVIGKGIRGSVGKIPKLVHQSWRSKHIPPRLSKSKEAWERHHPEWVYVLWTDKDIKDYIKEYHREFIDMLGSRITQSSQLAEILSYLVMYDFGGIYSDLKFNPRKNISSFFEGGASPYVLYDPYTNSFTNSIMASAPGDPFWKDIWKRMLSPEVPSWAMGGYLEKKYTTGIAMFNKTVQAHERSMGLLPSNLFNPRLGGVSSIMSMAKPGLMSVDKAILGFFYEHRFKFMIVTSILSIILIYLVYRHYILQRSPRNKV